MATPFDHRTFVPDPGDPRTIGQRAEHLFFNYDEPPAPPAAAAAPPSIGLAAALADTGRDQGGGPADRGGSGVDPATGGGLGAASTSQDTSGQVSPAGTSGSMGLGHGAAVGAGMLGAAMGVPGLGMAVGLGNAAVSVSTANDQLGAIGAKGLGFGQSISAGFNSISGGLLGTSAEDAAAKNASETNAALGIGTPTGSIDMGISGTPGVDNAGIDTGGLGSMDSGVDGGGGIGAGTGGTDTSGGSGASGAAGGGEGGAGGAAGNGDGGGSDSGGGGNDGGHDSDGGGGGGGGDARGGLIQGFEPLAAGGIVGAIRRTLEDAGDDNHIFARRKGDKDPIDLTPPRADDFNERTDLHLPGDLAQRQQRFDPAPSLTMTGQREDGLPQLAAGGLQGFEPASTTGHIAQKGTKGITQRRMIPRGLVASATDGRADLVKRSVPKDTYVVPADVVSGLGQGNSLSGGHNLNAALGGVKTPKGYQRGGDVDVMLSGGEHLVPPGKVAGLGYGDPKAGARRMDGLVAATRRSNAHAAMNLPGPNQ